MIEEYNMKKEKKLIFALPLVFFTLVGIAVCSQVGNAKLVEGSGDSNQVSYSLTLSGANKMTSAEASAKTFTRNTVLGNEITYVLNNTTYTSNQSAFAKVNPTGG